MKKRTKDGLLVASLAIVMLVIDQAIKISVKLGMRLYESIHITDWFYIYFTENNGMAFGMEIFGKLFLTSFRLIAIVLIIWYVLKIAGKGFPKGYLVALALIIAGAAGNIFDSLFYGEIFSVSTPSSISHLVPWGEGYSRLFYGKVVDMLYFPLVEWNWPSWMPGLAGKHFIFFSPIFNFADSCITVGLFMVILFYSKCLNWGIKHPEVPQEYKDKHKKEKHS
ncbi:MAG: lipoprotein signal peptidase [Bacteroidaceae bacterium]|nr:lipoprotein signal peptidase [Bacteroidaceae bacterium]